MSGPDSPVLVVTAIREELRPILRHFDRVEEKRIGGLRVFHSALCRASLLFAATGDGTAIARRRAGQLCDAVRPTALFGVGAAGALTSSLAALDLLAGARVRDGAGEGFSANSVLLSLATGMGALPGTILTVRAPVVSAAAKEALARSLPSGERAAVDMESAGWSEAAAESGIPFVAVRAIADTASEELPDYLPDCLGPGGGIRRAAVVARALSRPSSIPDLLRWRRRVSACGEKLASFLWDLFDCERWV